jgi:rare lipoprotein A
MHALIVGTLAAAASALAPFAAAHAQTGIASHYSDLSMTASGRSYKASALVAAHRSLPFGTKVLVKSASTGRSVVVTIVDRGPFIKGRIIDLSKGAANALGFSGLHRVHVAVVGKDGPGKPDNKITTAEK